MTLSTETALPGAQLKADYEDLGISLGYIGNVYYGPMSDDRSFRVFTRVETRQYAGLDLRGSARFEFRPVSIVVFDVPRSHKGFWDEPIQFDTPEVRAQLDALRAKVASGEARMAGVR